MALTDSDIEAVAARVVELLAAGRADVELVDAVEIARRFGVSREFVYSHAEELGAIRLGAGRKPRLRFDPAKVSSLLRPPTSPEGKERPNRHRYPKRRGSALLPVHGRTTR